MRTIKFRGKRLDNSKWEYGDLCYPIMHGTLRTTIFCDMGFIEVADETVGQFTGLLDRNGKEIYEGDILKFGSSDNGVCEVGWNDNVTAFCIRFFFEESLGVKPFGAWCELERDIIIIGNIHDNPELLNNENT